MNAETLRVGPRRSPKLWCRLVGCQPRETTAIVRVHLVGFAARTFSEHRAVQVCRRCNQLTAEVTVPAETGQLIDSVTVQLEEPSRYV